MKNWLKAVLILLGGFVFYLLTGNGSIALLLIVLLGYMEYRTTEAEK